MDKEAFQLMIARTTGRSRAMLPVLAMGLVMILFFFLHKPTYILHQDTFFWLGLLLLPFSLQWKKQKGGRRFFWLALLCGLLSIPFTTTFGVYCMLVFALLFLLEQWRAKLSILLPIHLLLLSPVFPYISRLISFPIRLGLSEAAGDILALAGFDIQISGNLIQLNGRDFLVDSACAGLYMLRYSFLFALLMLAYFQRQGKSWKLPELAGLLLLLLPLNIMGNLVRIVILIVFGIMPEHWFHEVLGLITFFIYSLLPFYFISKNLAGKEKHTVPASSPGEQKNSPGIHFYGALVVLFLCFSFICWKNGAKSPRQPDTTQLPLTAYQTERVREVYKLSNERALIYIKPPVEAYNADHNPLICWQGSGYEFQHISTSRLGQLEVSIAELKKEGSTLYTMWWYDSGRQQTGSQWDWRWQTLNTQEAFYLVNVTAESPDILRAEAWAFLNQKIIR
ncbi:exosortase N [Nafulsella turpanensis]|uniref:exosortase N n=1 Tax=Nafulsella turpanensis TaxID=1265690 RepID=UPI00038203C8|nr:exosortase N [Nafulsella turpanensis]